MFQFLCCEKTKGVKREIAKKMGELIEKLIRQRKTP